METSPTKLWAPGPTTPTTSPGRWTGSPPQRSPPRSSPCAGTGPHSRHCPPAPAVQAACAARPPDRPSSHQHHSQVCTIERWRFRDWKFNAGLWVLCWCCLNDQWHVYHRCGDAGIVLPCSYCGSMSLSLCLLL
jgi:hypothetical protein